MDDTAPSPSECELCDSEGLEYFEDLSAWVCEHCSHVINDENLATEEIEPQVDWKSEKQEDSTEDEDWTAKVTVKDKPEENLVELLSQTEEIVSDLQLDESVEIITAEIVTKAWETNFMHGRSKIDTLGAAVYLASRQNGCAIPPGIIAERVGSNKQSMKKTYSKLKQKQNVCLDPPSPEDYIQYFCKRLNLSKDIEDAARERVFENKPLGGNPIGIAGASVYIAANNQLEDNITLRQIAAISTLTKETIWRQKRNIC